MHFLFEVHLASGIFIYSGIRPEQLHCIATEVEQLLQCMTNSSCLIVCIYLAMFPIDCLVTINDVVYN